MINALLVGVANFVFIFLKAFQQRNVAFLHYGWVLPTSVLMAVAEVLVIGAVALEATQGDIKGIAMMVAAIALGGGTGCILSMKVHDKYLSRKEDTDEVSVFATYQEYLDTVGESYDRS